MDVLEAIRTRRSVRHFTGRPVAEEILQTLLQAAMQAPSAVNAQTWQFVLLTELALLREVTTFHPSAEAALEAQAGILVCGDESLQKRPNRWVMDCSAAAENILLAAHGLGLGGVWLGLYPESDRMAGMSKLVNLPGDVHPLALIALGYPVSDSAPVDRFLPERIHRNHW